VMVVICPRHGFFDLRAGVAGECAQKFVNYRVRLAVIGDISAHTERSEAVPALVAGSTAAASCGSCPLGLTSTTG
jgi:hypothetical protein